MKRTTRSRHYQRMTHRRYLTRLEEQWCDEALRRLTLAGLVRDDSHSVEPSTMDREPGQSYPEEAP